MSTMSNEGKQKAISDFFKRAELSPAMQKIAEAGAEYIQARLQEGCPPEIDALKQVLQNDK